MSDKSKLPDRIIITQPDRHPNVTAAFVEAVEKAKEVHNEVDEGCVYRFEVELISQIFNYYDFGERNSWEFVFKIHWH